MNEKELRKAYDAEWKKNQPTKYLVWLICYVGSFVPLAMGALQLVGGLDDGKVVTMVVCILAFFVLEIIAAVVMTEHKRGWKAYLDSHKAGK